MSTQSATAFLITEAEIESDEYLVDFFNANNALNGEPDRYTYRGTDADMHLYSCGCGGCITCGIENHPDAANF